MAGHFARVGLRTPGGGLLGFRGIRTTSAGDEAPTPCSGIITTFSVVEMSSATSTISSSAPWISGRCEEPVAGANTVTGMAYTCSDVLAGVVVVSSTGQGWRGAGVVRSNGPDLKHRSERSE